MQALMKIADLPKSSGLVSLNGVLHSHIGMRDKADDPVPGYVEVVHRSTSPTQKCMPCLLQPEPRH